MAIDIQSEKLYPLATAINQVFGRKLSAATAWRWVHKGVGGRRLEVVKLGAKTYVSAEALARFARYSGSDSSSPPIRSPRQQRRGAEQAERELATDFGI